MTIIDEILESPFFAERPPVLLDIGAAGHINHKWKPLARHSICIAFDADDREMGYIGSESTEYKKLHVFDSIVIDSADPECNFYLTRSPMCSSTLEPDLENLKKWNFGELFIVESTSRQKAITIPEVLSRINVASIDWFKTDSQGTDLRLFQNLGNDLIRKVLLAEFEPGIIDAYKGEDKLPALMQFMDSNSFWMNDICICGTQRFSKDAINYCLKLPVPSRISLRKSPCWAELSYFNSFAPESSWFDERDYLLGWIFSLIEGQYGFGLELALTGSSRFGIPVFEQLAGYSADLITRGG